MDIIQQCHIQPMYSTGTPEEEVSMHFFMVTDFLVRRLGLLKVAKPEKENRIISRA